MPLHTIKKKTEKAKLLRFDNYAEYSLDEQTAKTVEAVNSRLSSLTPPSVRNANKEAMKPLPRWMNHKNKNNNINNNAELNMQVAAKAALPKPTWLKRFKARILVNSKVNTVSQSTSRTSIFARIMNRVKLSFDEIVLIPI